MDAPLSGKQKREHMKFAFDEIRKNAAFKKEQRRKDALAQQQMQHKEQTQQAKLSDMGVVPPMNGAMPKPTNPEAGPNDKIPALLAPGEAVIPASAAQNPKNKPLVKALVREGRSDRNLSVPKVKGMECGTTNMKGYEWGSPEVAPNDVGFHNAELSDSEGYGVLQGYELGSADVEPLKDLLASNNIDTGGWSYGETGATGPQGQFAPYTSRAEDRATATPANLDRQLMAIPDYLSNFNTNASNWFNDKLSKQTNIPVEKLGNNKIVPAPTVVPAKTVPNELPPEAGALDVPYITNKEDPAYGWSYFKDYAIDPEGNKVQYTTAEQDKATASEGWEPTPPTPPENVTLVSEKDGIKTYSDGTTIDDAGIYRYNGQVVYTPSVPTKSGFDKWTGFIGDALKGAYESITDPEKLKGALSSTLETLGFNGRDAGRFAMLVAGSKALGYNTTQAVRHAGAYTLKASDQRASDEASLKKALEVKELEGQNAWRAKGGIVAKGGEKLPNGTTAKAGDYLPGLYKDTGETRNITFQTGTDAAKNIQLVKKVQGGTGDAVWVDRLTGLTEDQLTKKYNESPMPHNYESTGEGGKLKDWDSFTKKSKDSWGDYVNQMLPINKEAPDHKANIETRKRLPGADAVSAEMIAVLKKQGYPISDKTAPDLQRILNRANELIVEDAQKGIQVKLADTSHYINKASLYSATGITNDLFVTSKGKNMNAADISKQYESVKDLVLKDNPDIKSPAELKNAVSKKYTELASLWNNPSSKIKDEKDLQSNEFKSGFYYFVDDYIGKNKVKK